MVDSQKTYIKVILFDVDNVFVNVGGKYFSQHLEEDFGIPTSVTEEFFITEHQDCIVGKKDLKEVLPQYLKKWGWQGTADELIRYWHKSEHFINEDLVNEVTEYKNRGIRVYLATNQDRYRTQYILNEMGFGKIVDGDFASAHIGYKKPSKEYFIEIVKRLKRYNVAEILFWDDSLENVEAARQVGLQAEQYNEFSAFKKIMEEKYHL